MFGPTTTRVFAAAAALVLTSACTDRPPEPVLEIEPVSLGGPHASLFGALFDPIQGYRVAYLGESRSFDVRAETWRDGERIEVDHFGGMSYVDGPVEFTLALLTRPSTQEDGPLALLFASELNNAVAHKETPLEAWSEVEGAPGISVRAAWNEPVRLDCALGEPVTIWRWAHGEGGVRHTPLTDPPGDSGETVLEVTLTFTN